MFAYADLHYWPILERLNLEGTLARRRVARTMVKSFVEAKAIILTLGLTEAWYHEPSKMYCNAVSDDVLARHPREFTFHRIGFDENRRSLERILDFIARHHATGDYCVFVMVSPVPLQKTFSGQDIIVANTGSKATLQAVAEEVCSANDRAVYFPSYEIAMLSNPAVVWRPDRLHVQDECVKHITSVFARRYTDRNVDGAPKSSAAPARSRI